MVAKDLSGSDSHSPDSIYNETGHITPVIFSHTPGARMKGDSLDDIRNPNRDEEIRSPSFDLQHTPTMEKKATPEVTRGFIGGRINSVSAKDPMVSAHTLGDE